MIDSYGLMAVPMCALIHHLTADRKWIPSLATMTLVGCLIALNYFQMWQYRITLMHWDSMNRDFYKTIFLSKQWPENYEALKTPPNYEKAKLEQEGF